MPLQGLQDLFITRAPRFNSTLYFVTSTETAEVDIAETWYNLCAEQLKVDDACMHICAHTIWYRICISYIFTYVTGNEYTLFHTSFLH